MHRIPRKGAGHAPWEAPRVGKNPSGPSRPPYLTGAASPGRNHGAAGPVRLLRRRHLPAPGPRPRRQPRPVPDGASAIARDFTLRPTRQPPYPAGALKPRLSREPLPAKNEPAGPPYSASSQPPVFHLVDVLPALNFRAFSASVGAYHRLHSLCFLE